MNAVKKYKLKKFNLLIVMYNGGYPLNAYNFVHIKKKYKCHILEDACHALGAEYFYNNKTVKLALVLTLIFQYFLCIHLNQ